MNLFLRYRKDSEKKGTFITRKIFCLYSRYFYLGEINLSLRVMYNHSNGIRWW